MPSIDIMGTGRLDERESAFPQAMQFPSREVLCSFGVGGGARATGGAEFARSTDGGETWTLAGSILPPTTNPDTSWGLPLSSDYRQQFNCRMGPSLLPTGPRNRASLASVGQSCELTGDFRTDIQIT